jgi:hypothetical protein
METLHPPTEEPPRYPLIRRIGDRVGPRSNLNTLEKRKSLVSDENKKKSIACPVT